MGFASSYLEKHAFFDSFIEDSPQDRLSLVVVIPCYNEPDLLTSLRSLYYADKPSFPVEILIAVNSSEDSGLSVLNQNRTTINEVKKWADVHCSSDFMVYALSIPPFPRKHAGAGFARKAGMDEAVRRFNSLDNPNGIVVSFDADSVCDRDYFTELEKLFFGGKPRGCTIYFEHPLYFEGGGFNKPIAEYELYLRYFVQAMRESGFPYAFHTVGSCFSVTAGTYAAMGGMNRKTAGEDFYFLQKVIPHGRFTELNTTRVVPSARVSDRVPFGTGATMRRVSGSEYKAIETWPTESFFQLKELFGIVPDLYLVSEQGLVKRVKELPEYLQKFLTENGFIPAVNEMQKHSAKPDTFSSRFYTWFNAFRILKFLNFSKRISGRTDHVIDAASELLEISGVSPTSDIPGNLEIYRKIQRETRWKV